MSPVVKFWIGSTLVLFLLMLWPLRQMSPETTGTSESALASEARLVDHFCLTRTPDGGKVNIPKSWEEALDANIRVRDTAGEAAADIGLPREQSERLTSLKAGNGMFHEDQRGHHYVLRSAQGSNWFVVLSQKPTGALMSSNAGAAKPSPLAMTLALAMVGGGLMTLLARVAFGKSDSR